MADNNRSRGNRDNEISQRLRPQAGAPSGDPLAELARLIGQQNESAPSYRQNGLRAPYGGASDPDQGWTLPNPVRHRDDDPRDATPHGGSYAYPDDAAPVAYAAGGYPSGHGYDNEPYDPRYDAVAPQADRDYGAGSQTSYAGPRYAGPEGQYADPRYDPRYSDPRYADPRQNDPRYADPGYADPGYGDPRYADARHADRHYDDDASRSYADRRYTNQPQTDPRYADAYASDPRYQDAADGFSHPHFAEPNFDSTRPQYMPASSHAAAPHAHPVSGPYAGYGDGAQNYGGSYYGSEVAPAVAPASNRRAPQQRRGSMVTVLAVLALAVVGTASAFGYRAMFGGAGTPVPPPVIKADTKPSKIVPATDPSAKPIQDRVGVKTERIVPREEEPVQQAAPGQPRVISPWLAGQNPQAFPPASANVAPPSDGSSAASQGARPVTAEPKRIRTVPIKPDRGAEVPATAPRSARAVAPAAQENDAGAAPLALSPTGSVPPQRHAARPANAPASEGAGSGGASPFPTPISSGASQAVAGPYAVQVTSQRSEADAQASFRSLQQQFPSVLGSRQPVIRRADLGDRGTYYRAQIPFQSQGEASEFCSNLKAAGGQCVVQRN